MDHGEERMQPRQDPHHVVHADGYEKDYEKDWAAEMDDWSPEGHDNRRGSASGLIADYYNQGLGFEHERPHDARGDSLDARGSGDKASTRLWPDHQYMGPESSDDHINAFPTDHNKGAMGSGEKASARDDWTALESSTTLQVEEARNKLRALEDGRWDTYDVAAAKQATPNFGMGMVEQPLSRTRATTRHTGAPGLSPAARSAWPCSGGRHSAPADTCGMDVDPVSIESSEDEKNDDENTDEEGIGDNPQRSEIANARSKELREELFKLTTEAERIAGSVYSPERLAERWGKHTVMSDDLKFLEVGGDGSVRDISHMI